MNLGSINGANKSEIYRAAKIQKTNKNRTKLKKQQFLLI